MLDDRQGERGDVLYRPFSATGAITSRGGVRPVTLFEIEELVAFAAARRRRSSWSPGHAGSAVAAAATP